MVSLIGAHLETGRWAMEVPGMTSRAFRGPCGPERNLLVMLIIHTMKSPHFHHLFITCQFSSAELQLTYILTRILAMRSYVPPFSDFDLSSTSRILHISPIRSFKYRSERLKYSFSILHCLKAAFTLSVGLLRVKNNHSCGSKLHPPFLGTHEKIAAF